MILRNIYAQIKSIKNYKGQLGPSPYCFIINIHLMDINVLAKLYEIPSLLVQGKGSETVRP